MTVSDVVINLLCKKTVILTSKQVGRIFSGQGYPHTYGFWKNSINDSDWNKSFLFQTSVFDVINRQQSKYMEFQVRAEEMIASLKYDKLI